ncbi:MAG: hypothetical protein ACP5OS_09615, partial [Leptospirillia bacterium]
NLKLRLTRKSGIQPVPLCTGPRPTIYVGRVAVRASGSFNIQTGSGVLQGISHKVCRLLQRADGYGYSLVTTN